MNDHHDIGRMADDFAAGYPHDLRGFVFGLQREIGGLSSAEATQARAVLALCDTVLRDSQRLSGDALARQRPIVADCAMLAQLAGYKALTGRLNKLQRRAAMRLSATVIMSAIRNYRLALDMYGIAEFPQERPAVLDMREQAKEARLFDGP